VRTEACETMARLAAETVAARLGDSNNSHAARCVSIGDVAVWIEKRDDECRIATEVHGQVFRFACSQLSGAAPEAFSSACAAADPSAVRLAAAGTNVQRAEFPRLDAASIQNAPRAGMSRVFRRDTGVALLTWETGTEKDDFVFIAESSRGGLDVFGPLVVVPGNLWIEIGDRPLRLQLDHDLVVVVMGNLYVGRPVVVDGPGRLVLATTIGESETAFADVDANGRWSSGDEVRGAASFRGPFEGAGNVYLGLPRATGKLTVQASIAVAGQLHLAGSATVGGPVVLAHGITGIGSATARLEPRGSWCFQVEREGVPGFATKGAPRPGLLRRCEIAAP
jgi:hypothetical protein